MGRYQSRFSYSTKSESADAGRPASLANKRQCIWSVGYYPNCGTRYVRNIFIYRRMYNGTRHYRSRPTKLRKRAAWYSPFADYGRSFDLRHTDTFTCLPTYHVEEIPATRFMCKFLKNARKVRPFLTRCSNTFKNLTRFINFTRLSTWYCMSYMRTPGRLFAHK